MSFGPVYDHDIPEGHRSAEARDLKPTDQYLRDAGWSIHARPTHGPAVWARGGLLMTTDDALVTSLCEENSKG